MNYHNSTDEYLYQKLGYKDIAEKIRGTSADEVEQKSTGLEWIKNEPVTEEEVKKYKEFYRMNIKESIEGIEVYILFLSFLAALLPIILGVTGNKLEWGLTYSVPLWFVFIGKLFSMGEKYYYTPKPIGKMDGYIASASIESIEYNAGEKAWVSSVDLWFSETDEYVLFLRPRLYAFKYAGVERRWPEMVYLPVRVYLLGNGNYDMVPIWNEKN